MKIKTISRASCSALMTLVLTTAGVISAPATAASDPTKLVIGQLQFVPNSHPLIQVNNTKLFLMGFIQRPVTAFDARGQSVCLLCEKKPSLENGLAKIVDLPGGKTGMQVTLKLRADAKWGDGTPVSSQDIALTWKMAQEGALGFSNYNAWTRATKVDIVNPTTAVLHLDSVETGYDSWDQVLPSHIEGPIYAKYKTAEEYVKQSAYNREPTNPGLWNGAYTLTSMQMGAQITLAPNKFWPTAPQLKTIVLSYRSNAAALIQNLLSGDLDALPVSPGGISFSQMLTLRKQQASRFDFPVQPGYNLERLVFQTQNPALSDVRVRRAIAHAINREAISTQLFEKLQPVATSILAENSSNHSNTVTRYKFDPARAKALLTEAGWKPGSDGICINPAGQKLSIELVTTAGNQTRVQIAQVIQNQLKSVCIDAPVKQVQIGVYNGEEMRKRKFTGMGLSSIQFPPSTSPEIYLATNGIPTEKNGFTGNNFSGYSSPAMDAAVQEAERALQPAAAKAAWAKVQQIALDDLPILPLYYYASSWVVPKGMKGLDAPRYDQPTNWAEYWKRAP